MFVRPCSMKLYGLPPALTGGASLKRCAPTCCCRLFVESTHRLFVLFVIYLLLQLGIHVVEEKNVAYLRTEMLSLFQRSEDNHMTIHPPTINDDKEQRIMLTGLTRSTDEIKTSIWESLNSYCRNFTMSVHIQTRDESPDVQGARQKLSNCFEVVLRSDAEATQDIVGLPNDSWESLYPWGPFRELGHRVAKITRAREGMLSDIRKYARDRGIQKTLKSIVVVDLDMDVFPSVNSLSAAVTAVGPNGKWDAICSDGVDQKEVYYDTFATVVSFATFLTLPLDPSFRPLMHELNGFTYYFSRVEWLMRKFQSYVTDDPRPFIPVRSCFGGVGVYRASQLIEMDCSYTWRNEYMDDLKLRGFSGKGDILCEHIRLHLCLEQKNKLKLQEFKIGISKNMNTRWGEL